MTSKVVKMELISWVGRPS